MSDVYLIIFKRKYHDYAIPIPKRIDMLILLGSKIIWLGLSIGVPIAVGYTPIETLVGFCIAYMIAAGLVSGNVFMMAHVMQPAEFIQPHSDSNNINDQWAIFQIKTTVDFAPKNRFQSLVYWRT